MRKKLLLLSICFVSMLINCSLAQELATYDTEYGMALTRMKRIRYTLKRKFKRAGVLVARLVV